MDKFEPHKKDIPKLGFHNEEPKESIFIYPKFHGCKPSGFGISIKLTFNSLKDLFRKRF